MIKREVVVWVICTWVQGAGSKEKGKVPCLGKMVLWIMLARYYDVDI